MSLLLHSKRWLIHMVFPGTKKLIRRSSLVSLFLSSSVSCSVISCMGSYFLSLHHIYAWPRSKNGKVPLFLAGSDTFSCSWDSFPCSADSCTTILQVWQQPFLGLATKLKKLRKVEIMRCLRSGGRRRTVFIRLGLTQYGIGVNKK